MIFDYFSLLYKKFFKKKISYSQGGIDLLLNHIFRNKKNGFYIDIGCNHPIKNNNTYLFYKKGWSGINIDLDKKNIDLFKLFRPRDKNINWAISSSDTEHNLFFYHDKSPINTISKLAASYQNAKVKEIRKIKTQTLNSILDNLNLENKQIDFISLDVEGHEFEVMKGLDLKKYKPQIIVLEYLDLTLKQLEIKNLNINNILKSQIYLYLIEQNFSLVNWLHSDLVFVNNKFKD